MKRALVCEDDVSIRKLVGVVLRGEGFEVDLAENGGAGMQQMRSGCYDLIMLDLMMPGVDGYAVIDYLKNQQPDRLRRVVVMTAVTEALRREFPGPVCEVIAKPFDVDALRRVVRSCARACDGGKAEAVAT